MSNNIWAWTGEVYPFCKKIRPSQHAYCSKIWLISENERSKNLALSPNHLFLWTLCRAPKHDGSWLIITKGKEISIVKVRKHLPTIHTNGSTESRKQKWTRSYVEIFQLPEIYLNHPSPTFKINWCKRMQIKTCNVINKKT